MRSKTDSQLLDQRRGVTSPPAEPQECVVYRRVSSKGQENEGWSLDSQLREAQNWAERNGYKLVGDYIESRSAKEAGRPEFARMMVFLAEHPGVFILTEKTDRLLRNRKDDVLLDQLNISAYFLREDRWKKADSRSHDRLIHRFKVMIAENYSENLSERNPKRIV